jgi:hypothetical protein
LQANCYSAQVDRLMLASLVCAEGVADVGGGSLLVTSGGSGLNVSVAQGGVWIEGDDDDRGFAHGYNDDPVTLTAGPNASGSPRIDTVVARLYDSSYGEGADEWQLEIIAGTPDADAQIADPAAAGYLDGIADLTGLNAVPLGYIWIPNGFAGPFVNATHLLDGRRPFGSCAGKMADYEPVLSDPLASNTESEFRYSRSGDMVTVQFVIVLAADASTDPLTIGLPPFLPARVPAGVLNYLAVGVGNYFVDSGSTTIVVTPFLDNADFVQFTTDGVGAMAGPVAVNDYLMGTFTYETTAS